MKDLFNVSTLNFTLDKLKLYIQELVVWSYEYQNKQRENECSYGSLSNSFSSV